MLLYSVSSKDRMKDYSFYIDKKLRITAWDEHMSGLTGVSRRRAVGKKYYEVIPKITINNRDAAADAIKKKKTVSLQRCRYQCLYAHSGASFRISPHKNGNGAVQGAKVVVRPTASCSAVRKLNRSHKFIAIGKVASTLAHGVKNPLNAIKGAVVYIRDRYAQEEPLIEFMEIMEAEISRLESFITRFLGTAPQPTGTQSVNINSLIEKIKILLSLQTYAQNIRCEYVLNDIPTMAANPFHIEQALLSVVNNAIEAMKSGGVLTIRTRTEQGGDGDFVVIEITDTGPGMDAKHIEEPVPDETTGRGFGLFIAYEMVKYYGGRLEIHGEKGKGTTATFYLPCNAA